MPDFGREVTFGYFLVPNADEPLLATAQEVERLGLDYVAVQDHPYQRRYVDTWVLMSMIAATTSRVAHVPRRRLPAASAAGGDGEGGSEPGCAQRRSLRAGAGGRRLLGCHRGVRRSAPRSGRGVRRARPRRSRLSGRYGAGSGICGSTGATTGSPACSPGRCPAPDRDLAGVYGPRALALAAGLPTAGCRLPRRLRPSTT